MKTNSEKDTILTKTFQAMNDVSEPEMIDQQRMQAKYIQNIQKIRPQIMSGVKPQNRSFLQTLPRKWRTSSMTVKIIGVIVAITTILSGAGAGTVFAAQSAMPDDALYTLKVWSEETRLDLAKAPEDDLALHLSFADRRLEELLTLQEEGTALDPELQIEMTAHMWMAEQLAEDCEDPVQAQQQIRQRLMTQEQLLTNAPEDALMTQTHSMVRQQLQLMECETGDEECKQQACEDGGCMSSEKDMTHEQMRKQLREDQPEGAGSETGNGFTGEYPEPQQGKDKENGNGNDPNSENCDPEGEGDCTGEGQNQNESPGPGEDHEPGSGGNENGNGN